MIKYHRNDHPIRERELREFGLGFEQLRNERVRGFVIMNPRLSF